MFHAVKEEGNAVLMIIASMAALSYVYMNLMSGITEAEKHVQRNISRLQRFRLITEVKKELANEVNCNRTFKGLKRNQGMKDVTLIDTFGKPFLGKRYNTLNLSNFKMLSNKVVQTRYNEYAQTSFLELQMIFKNQKREFLQRVPLIAKWKENGSLDWCTVYSETDYKTLRNGICNWKGGICELRRNQFANNSLSACSFKHSIIFNNENGQIFCY
jgi:hypothetical protein